MNSERPPRDSPASSPPIDATASFDPGAEASVTESIVSAVCSAQNVEPMELDPLYSAVDPEPLAAFVRSLSSRPDGLVSFRYAGCAVAVHCSGRVDVTALES